MASPSIKHNKNKTATPGDLGRGTFDGFYLCSNFLTTLICSDKFKLFELFWIRSPLGTVERNSPNKLSQVKAYAPTGPLGYGGEIFNHDSNLKHKPSSLSPFREINFLITPICYDNYIYLKVPHVRSPVGYGCARQLRRLSTKWSLR